MRLVAMLLAALVAGPGLAMSPLGSPAAAAPSRTAQDPGATGPPAVMLLVDVSGSMSEVDARGNVKIESARAALLSFLDAAEPGVRMGLRTYPGQGSGCDSGTLEFPVTARDPAEMAARIRTLRPNGDTPTPQALEAAAADLRAAGARTGSIVLVSDGESTCGSPCDVAASIAASGVSIQVNAVGLAVSDAAAEELRCIADATDGAYIDAGDGEELERILDELTAAEVSVELTHSEKVVAEVGDARSGFVEVSLRITSTGSVAAEDVTARIRFDDHEVAVTSPVRAMGHLPPSTERVVVWRFRPGLHLAGETIDFTTTVAGPNLPAPTTHNGKIEVLDVGGADDAGPVLADAGRIVVLGDSYSSGEGAGDYVKGTDSTSNSCHRSSLTYLVETFEVPEDLILACSGAVTADFWAADEDHGIESQITQLSEATERYPGQIGAAVLTIGGNDLGFGPIVISCLTRLATSCTEEVKDDDLGTQPTKTYLATKAGARDDGTHQLVDDLAKVYAGVHAFLNSDEQQERRGRLAPILVLGYPRILPGAKVRCSLFLSTLSQAEFDLATEIVTTLNGYVESAVRSAAERGIPVVYVPNTEDSFLPGNTMCSDDPWVRNIESIDLGVSLEDLFRMSLPNRREYLAGEKERRLQELFHPNASGYDGETNAILRWSQTVAADAVTFERKHFVFDVPDPVSLDQLQGAPVIDLQGDSQVQLQAGDAYRLQGSGFAPGLTVTATLNSTRRVLGASVADLDGNVEVVVVVPDDVEPGDHELQLEGASTALELTALSRPAAVQQGSALPWPWIVAGIGVLLAGAGFGLRRRLTEVTSQDEVTDEGADGSLTSAEQVTGEGGQ